MKKFLFLVLMMVVCAALAAEPFASFVKDDAFISANYSRSLASGEGMTFAGEKVEGYSNFAWVILGTIPQFFHGSEDVVIWFYRLVSIIAAGFLGLGVMRLSLFYSRLAKPDAGKWTSLSFYAAVLAGVTLVSATSIGYYIASGMETVLFTALCVWAMVFVVEDKYHSALAVAVLAALARPEGHLFVILAGCAAIVFVFRRERPLVAIKQLTKFAVIPTAVLAAYHGWRWYYFGDLLPNTYYIKSSGGGLLAMGFDDLFKVFNLQAFAALPLLSLLVIPLVFSESKKRAAQLAAHWLLGAFFFAYLVWVGGDEMAHGRMLLPGLAIMAAMSGGAVYLLLSQVKKPFALAVLAILTVGMAYSSRLEATQVGAVYDTWYPDMKSAQGGLCQDLAKTLPKGSLVAYQDMGFCPYSTGDKLKYLDFIGLVTKSVADLRHEMKVPMFGVVPIQGQENGTRLKDFWERMCDLIFIREPAAIALVIRVDEAWEKIHALRDSLPKREFTQWMIKNAGGFGFSPGLQWDPRFADYQVAGIYPRDQRGGHIYLVSFVREPPAIAGMTTLAE